MVEHIADLNNGHFNVFLNVLLSLFVTDDAKSTRVSEEGNNNVPNSNSTSKRSRFEETDNNSSNNTYLVLLIVTDRIPE